MLAVKKSKIKKALRFLLTISNIKNRLHIWSGLQFLYFTITKMTKNVTINNVNYEVKNFEIPMWLKSFYNLYDRPSNEKVEIYEEWTGILNEIYGCAGSKFAFTIYGNVIDENGEIHDVRISKCHNYIK